MLEALYFAAQIIAALAVFGSLLFVGFEVRRSTRAHKLQLGMERTALFTQSQSWIIENEKLRKVLIKGALSYDALSTEEKLVFSSYYQHWLGAMIAIWAHEENDWVDPKHSAPFYFTVAQFANIPGAQEWWAHVRPSLAPEFQEKFGAIMDTGKVEEGDNNDA